MNNEVNELLDKLEKLENAPLIWVNKKVYDASKEIERLNNIINELEKYLDSMWLDDKGIVLRIKDKLQELKGSDK